MKVTRRATPRPSSGTLRVPAENRVGRDDRHNLRQQPTTERRASQTPPFVVGEPHALVAQARFQDPVLFTQVLDDLVLLVLEPADETRDEQVQRNHPASLRQTAGRGLFGHYGPSDKRGTVQYTQIASARRPRVECGSRLRGI
jgi:hypothetical protein